MTITQNVLLKCVVRLTAFTLRAAPATSHSSIHRSKSHSCELLRYYNEHILQSFVLIKIANRLADHFRELLSRLLYPF